MAAGAAPLLVTLLKLPPKRARAAAMPVSRPGEEERAAPEPAALDDGLPPALPAGNAAAAGFGTKLRASDDDDDEDDAEGDDRGTNEAGPDL